MTPLGRLVAVSAIGGLLVAGCGASDEPATGASAEQLAEAFGTGAADYEPAGGPDELARRSQLVIDGRIEGFNEGRIYGKAEDDPEASQTAVMVVSVERVLGGDLPTKSDGKVYVELLGVEKPSDFSDVLPARNDAIIYLTALPEGGVVPGPVANERAGVPPDQPLYGFVTPQGFNLATSQGVSQPLDGTLYEGASLRDFEPDEKDFPPHKSDARQG